MVDATELFMKQCQQAKVDPDSILAFGRRKLKPAPPPKVSEFAQPLGRVVGYEGGEDVVQPTAVAKAAEPKPTVDHGTHHHVLGTPLAVDELPTGAEAAVFATGCFWGAEKGFWRIPGVLATACVYAPTQEARLEAVRVVFNPELIAYADLLRWFWQCHDPTQADGQGNDKGPAYQSAIFFSSPLQHRLAELSRNAYQIALCEAGHPAEITTRLLEVPALILAETHHQQYLAKPGARAVCSARPLPIELPAYTGGWGDAAPGDAAPKLGAAFWRKHGPSPQCVLRVPDTQIKWCADFEDTEYTGVAATILGQEPIMRPKANGNTESGPQDTLRWGCDRKLADQICCKNREGAENAGYFGKTSFLQDVAPAAEGVGEVTFYDSVTGCPLFVVGRWRSWEAFVAESRAHGWPSFRDEEVLPSEVRMLHDGEMVSLAGTHLGHNLPDEQGNRYCINLVSIAGSPA